MRPSSPSNGGYARSESSKAAVDRLMVRVYQDLRTLASRYLRFEAPAHILQTTALVHESYLRLARLRGIAWRGRTHFLAVAANQMRRVLVDHARSETAAKRGGRALRVTLHDEPAGPAEPAQLLEIHEALEELGRRHERQERVAELRLFSGLDFAEIAATVGRSERTVREDWVVARAWLARRLRRPAREGA